MNLTYKNPFSEYTANLMDPKQILEYWCNPYSDTISINFDEIFSNRNPMVFMGGRGTGKTMFLRYYSYEVQSNEILCNNNYKNGNLISHLKNKGGIGFYIRFDGPLLRSFYGKGLSEDKWNLIFTHYFELMVCKSYIQVIKDLTDKCEINKGQVENDFVPRVARLIEKSGNIPNSLDSILEKIEEKLYEVTQFRTNIAFRDDDFIPSYGSQYLSFKVAEIALSTIDELKENINFIIIIDEYENFVIPQQRIINTLLKFAKPKITFRIGMRLEGFHTYDTITENEFVKEGRDYNKFIFESLINNSKKYQEFLLKVAEKRLKSVPIFEEKKFTDIRHFLGKRENLENEAIVFMGKKGNKHDHFDSLKYAPIPNDNRNKVIKIISYPANPLIEMLNILWVIRGMPPVYVRKVMKDYLSKKDNADVRKYKRDYIQKNKLSLMILLTSKYKQHKKYYSFNTLSFLSSGNVGQFIELCRKSFQYAYFEESQKLINEGVISPEVQDKAAKELAKSELEMIPRIHGFGNILYRLTKNLGNIFREYHKDPLVRYPETNQFIFDKNTIDNEETRLAFEAAIGWSIIQNKKADVYILNRIFSPYFDISYRTRGGQSGEKYTTRDIEILMTHESVRPKINLQSYKIKKTNNNKLNKTTRQTNLAKISDFFKE